MSIENPALTAWHATVARIGNFVDSLSVAELEVAQIHVEVRKRWLHLRQARPIDTTGMSGQVLEEAQRLNALGLERYRLAYPGFDGYQLIANAADRARHDSKFQKLLRHVEAGTVQGPDHE